MKAIRNFVSLLSLVALAAVGCKPDTSVDPNVEKLGRATGPSAGTASPKSMTPPPAVTTGTHSGTVQEVINVPRYSYLRLKTADGGEVWAAVPTAGIKIGDEAIILEQMIQKSFTSPSLDRTFDTLIFGTLQGGPAPQAAEGELPAGHPPVEGMKAVPAPGKLPAGHPPIGEKKDEAAEQEQPKGQPPVI